MASRYLLDTNTVSYIIKGSPLPVRSHLVQVPMADVHISTVTEAELRYGIARRTGASRLQAIVDQFLVRVIILPWDSTAAREYGELRAKLEREGLPMGNLDMMIAAHALAAKLVLVSNDHAFSRVKRLRIVDWTKP